MTIDEAAKAAWAKYCKDSCVEPTEEHVWERRAFESAYKTGRLEERGAIIEHLRGEYSQNRNARDFADLIESAPYAERGGE